MGITVCCSNKQFILIYSIVFIRMKLTLCLTVLCSYIVLSAASTIPDKKDLENDADRTSHPMMNGYEWTFQPFPGYEWTSHGLQPIPPPPPAPAPAPAPPAPPAPIPPP